jgi:hypothetical protein
MNRYLLDRGTARNEAAVALTGPGPARLHVRESPAERESRYGSLSEPARQWSVPAMTTDTNGEQHDHFTHKRD